MTLQDALMRRGIRWRAAANNHLAMCCLFCPDRGESPDERYRLYINLQTGKAYCFNCLFSSNFGFAAVLRKLQFQTSIELAPSQQEQPEAPPELPDDFQCLATTSCDLDRKARRYLLSRGITPGQIRDKNIGVSLIGRLSYRIIFPVTAGRELRGVVARDFTGQQEPKYLNSFGTKSLYNSHKSAMRAVLSEGVFKALRIERLGLGFSSMATLGRDITESQIEQLQAMKCKEVVIWPDPDRPGRRGAVAMADKMTEAGLLVGIVWPVHVPADEEDLEQMLDTWKNISGYSWALRQKLWSGMAA
jgi:hypothetical protein